MSRIAPYRLIPALLALCWACDSGNGSVERTGTTVYITGELTRTVAEAFADAINASTRRIVVSSEGGDEGAALSIAELLASRPDIKLEVVGKCLSGCAQYVFVAARQKTIKKGAVVACHHNAIAMSLVNERSYGSTYSPELLASAKRAKKLYAKLGVSQAYAHLCMYNVGPYCYFTTGSGLHAVRAVYDLWIPLATDFERLSIHNVAGAPLTVASANALIADKPIAGVSHDSEERDISIAEFSLRNNTSNCSELKKKANESPTGGRP